VAPNNLLEPELITRKLHLKNSKIDEKNRTASCLIVSKDNAVERYDYTNSREFIECLDPNGAIYRDSKPLLFNHNLHELPIGKAYNFRVGEEGLKADIKLDEDKRADEIFKKILSGSISNVSIGYKIIEYTLEERDGKLYKNAHKFEIYELSVVTVGADLNAKIGRSLEENTIARFDKNIVNEDKGEKKVEIELEVEKARSEEIRRVQEIREVGERFNAVELAQEHMKKGTSIQEFRSLVMDAIPTPIPIKSTSSNANLGLSKKEVRSYNFGKVVIAQLTNNFSDIGFELDCSRAVAEKLGKPPQGIYIPNDYISLQKRSDQDDNLLHTTTNTKDIVANTQRPDLFIEMLKAKSILPALGAEQITGLIGSQSIPRMTKATEAIWVEEGQAVDRSQLNFDFVPLSPRTIAGSTAYTRNMLMNSNPSIEALILSDLAQQLASGLEKATFTGDGVKKPLGILKSDYMKSLKDELDYKSVVMLEGLIEDENALEGSLHYVCSPKIKSILKTTPKQEGQPIYLLGEDGKMNGYQTRSTTHFPNTHLLFGNFSNLLFGFWGALDLMVDPYSSSRSGIIELHGYLTANVVTRNSGSFSVLEIPKSILDKIQPPVQP
jgi:HK97 family phage major capsid protein/HK97 family phage prohead protease